MNLTCAERVTNTPSKFTESGKYALLYKSTKLIHKNFIFIHLIGFIKSTLMALRNCIEMFRENVLTRTKKVKLILVDRD